VIEIKHSLNIESELYFFYRPSPKSKFGSVSKVRHE